MGSWQIVPLPQQVKEMSSAPFRITAKTTIYYAAGDEKKKKDADMNGCTVVCVDPTKIPPSIPPPKK